jgi:hypothetical protein
MTKEQVRQAIIAKLKEKRPDEQNLEAIADFILAQPPVNEHTYEVFMKSAGLL